MLLLGTNMLCMIGNDIGNVVLVHSVSTDPSKSISYFGTCEIVPPSSTQEPS
jgi:hypothetical protein